jgi:ribosomal subunit interface protein
MQIPLQITTRGIDQSDELEKHIRDKANKLDAFFEHVTSCRVVVEQPHKHHHQGNQYSVRIDIGVPGSEIVINRDHAEDVYVALRDAFDAAKRKLEDYVHKIRGEVKKHEPRYQPAGEEEIQQSTDDR